MKGSDVKIFKINRQRLKFFDKRLLIDVFIDG